jgi:hypothetical protein
MLREMPRILAGNVEDWKGTRRKLRKAHWLTMSGLGPGCVKTRLSRGCSELYSQLPSASSTYQCDWYPQRRNRDGNSTRRLRKSNGAMPSFSPPQQADVLQLPNQTSVTAGARQGIRLCAAKSA